MGHYQKKKKAKAKRGEELLLELRLGRSELQQMIQEGLQGLALEIGVEVATALLADEVEADRPRERLEVGRDRHQSRSDSTAMNASCGISTWPTRFMRFLPSACFSSNLRLRLMSPP